MYAPLYFIISYMAAALALAKIGPISYIDYDALKVTFYVSMILVSISIGYSFGVNRDLAAPSSRAISREPFPRYYFKIISVIALMGLVISFLSEYLSGTSNFDVSAIGETYIDGYKGYEMNSGNYDISFVLYSIFLLPTFIATIWGVYFFRYLNLYFKIAVVSIAFIFPLIFTLINGTQKNVGDIIIYLIAIFAIKSKINRKKISPKLVALISTIALSGVFLLSGILSLRYKAIGVDAFNINYLESYHLYVNTDNFIFKIFGPDMGFSIAILSGYLTNGLNGLSYALNSSGTWSFLLGTSYSISVIANRFFGLPFAYHDTYPYIVGLESGWDQTRWHSVFSWFASDFTFVGTVPLFGFFGFVYARAWKESIDYQNPFSILLFCLLTLGVFMMPANNQLMQTPGGLLTLAVIVFSYIRFRRPFNRVWKDGA